MPFDSENFIDEPMTRARRARLWTQGDGTTDWPQKKRAKATQQDEFAQATKTDEPPSLDESSSSVRAPRAVFVKKWPTLKRAHALSFAGLLLFTAVTYFRPYELIPALSGFTSMAFWLAVATLLVFLPTQLAVEGTLTARPREVNLVLLLALAALLSVPLAIDRSEAWPAFIDFAKVVTMFIVMINVVRTEMRLRLMFWLSLVVGIFLSIGGLIDYMEGHFDPHGQRIIGVIHHGLFENPNDLALYLVTLIPLALSLLFIARGINKKMLYGLCALVMVAGTVVTLSRGGLLGLACASFVLVWKMGRRHRLAVVVLFLLVGAIFLLALPPEFTGRLFSSAGEAEASSVARQNLLWRSIEVTIRHPLFGIGMNNFPNVSIHDQVTHNAYTQVSAEIGIPAMILYVLFILSSLKRLRGIERETYDSRARTRVYYLSIGLQASLVGYMVSSFFASVAYLWYIYYLVGYAVCLHRLYEAKSATGVFARASTQKPLNMFDETTNAPDTPLAVAEATLHER
jgi:putative inorganic carbon (HCO3(-)) transporter